MPGLWRAGVARPVQAIYIMKAQTFIFLTGLPRSGSTWAAQALAAATGARLVHEPFNWLRYPARERFHMRYLPAGAYEPELLAILHNTLKPRLPWQKRPDSVLVKDVHVCLALPYIWEHFRPQVIILVRHPCGMAQSWQALDLKVNFRLDLLLSQTALQPLLAPFAEHMRRQDDYFFALGAYWGASHYLLDYLSQEQPAWQWVTHEALCLDPVAHYRNLAASMGLGQGREAQLERFLTANDRRRTAGEGAHSTARITAQEPDKWRRRLTPQQISAVLAGAAPFGMLSRLGYEEA